MTDTDNGKWEEMVEAAEKAAQLAYLVRMNKRQYRYPTDLHWIADEQGYKRLEADDADSALARCPRSDITYSNMQVKTAQGWRWVTEVPVHLGGIAKHWFGEAI